MPTFKINGIATDGSVLNFETGAQLQLASTLFGDNISLTEGYQKSSHVSLGSDHFCLNTHLNNVKYISSTSYLLNETAPIRSITPGTPLPALLEATLKLTFTHTDVVTLSNPSMEAYDPAAPDSGAISDMNIRMFEIGNHISWQNINGLAKTFTSRSGADTYDWYFALSAVPLHGTPKTFDLRFAVSYV